jgi:RNA recognition motif-containing protein
VEVEPPTLLWAGGLFFTDSLRKEVVMEVEVYVRNLSKSTTQRELDALFTQAGDVTAVRVVADRKSGESKGFAFITMSAQSEADKAVSLFNAYFLNDHQLRVDLVRTRDQRGFR